MCSNLRRLHSVPKTDKGKDKIKENPPFMPALSFVSINGPEEPGGRRNSVIAWGAYKMVRSRSLRHNVRDVIRAGGPLSFSTPPHLLLTIKIANTTLSQYQIHTHQMAPPSSSIIQETAEKEPSEVLFFFFFLLKSALKRPTFSSQVQIKDRQSSSSFKKTPRDSFLFQPPSLTRTLRLTSP